MMKFYANVASTLALVVALGGTSYAAASLARNSVGTPQLKPNAVTGAKVRDGSLRAGDIGGPLPRGPQGPRGLPGPAGSDADVQARYATSALPGGGIQILGEGTPDAPQVRVLEVTGPAVVRANAQLSLGGDAAAAATVRCRLYLTSSGPTDGQEVSTTLVRQSVGGELVGGETTVSLSGIVRAGSPSGSVGIGCWYTDPVGVPAQSGQVRMSAARVTVLQVGSITD